MVFIFIYNNYIQSAADPGLITQVGSGAEYAITAFGKEFLGVARLEGQLYAAELFPHGN